MATTRTAALVVLTKTEALTGHLPMTPRTQNPQVGQIISDI